MSFTLPALPYSYKDLEPYYNEELLKIHHTKHHQAYTDKLNAAAKDAGVENKTIEDILTNLEEISVDKRTAVINNGGGYYNHTFFWESLSPSGGGEPKGEIAENLKQSFGSFESFQEKFSAKAATHFGSGWAWLVLTADKKLEIIDTHDQVCPLSLGVEPLLTIDVWEHAYYLQYKNVRPDWIKAFWSIVDWDKVEQRYLEAKASV
ncbi:superoxide dismutase [PVC group bacterium (ex Bugula neritina AB1)]|nr:superoxide dismutase [PVC group bacterium (ex Bugula neritina AB1)]